MLQTLAVANYRSLNKLVMPLGRLNLITGPNGSGKSNLYRALRLLAETAQGGVVNALAREGGLDSTFWAGPQQIDRRMRKGEVPIRATARTPAVALRLGFAGEDFGYCASTWGCRAQPSRASASTRRSSANASGPGRSSARPACWWIATARWCRAATATVGCAGRAHAELRQPVRSGRQLRSAAGSVAAARVHSRAGASTIIFAAIPTRRRASRNWARARRCCTTTAVTWRRPCRPSSRSATRQALGGGQRCVSRRAVNIEPARRTLRHRVLSGRVVAAVVGGGTVGRHVALSAAGRGAADAATAVADGAQRTGNQPAPGSAAGAGAVDHRARRSAARCGWCRMPAA